MKIGIQDNFGTLISNQSGPTLNFAQEGSNLQSKMADIENLNFSYNLKLSGQKRIMAYSTMVKGLATEREFLSSSLAGAVYFFRCGKCL